MKFLFSFFLCFLFCFFLCAVRENPFEDSSVLGHGYWTDGSRCVPIFCSEQQQIAQVQEKALQLREAEGLGG